MVVFERLGGWGLGNSLFQIATTYAIAKRNNSTFAFPDICTFRTRRFLEQNYFENELPWINFEQFNNYTRWGVGGIGYVECPLKQGNIVIDGFFQSDKYFKDYKSEIINLFSLKQEYIEYLKSKYSEVLNNSQSVSLHVRRGDSMDNAHMQLLEVEYFKKAVNIVGENKMFVIFSDDIRWCTENLKFITNKVFINEVDILEMHLMSMIRTNIITNSTFSWWGAYLGNNNTVYMPDPTTSWFTEKFYQDNTNTNTRDLIPEGWNII